MSSAPLCVTIANMGDLPPRNYSEAGTILSPRWDLEHVAWVNRVEAELGFSVCGARTKSTTDQHPCKNRAGYLTEHPGEGRCKFHGGSNPVKSGKFSMLRHYDLNAKVNEYIETAELMDIRSAVATVWATIDTLLDADSVITPDRAQEIVAAMGKVGTLIKQHHDITEGQKIMIEVPQFMEWAEHLYEMAIKYILAGEGDVRGFLTEAQGYYSSAVAIVTGDSPPEIGDGSGDEVEVLS